MNESYCALIIDGHILIDKRPQIIIFCDYDEKVIKSKGI